MHKRLCSVLKTLSNKDETIIPGDLKRMGLDDSRDIPMLKMPYGEVFILHASSGMRRILGLAYLLTWAWKEHLVACRILGEETASQITVLFDEIEAHLHPKWQRTIIPALLGVMADISHDTNVQLIAATHSPLVLASLEPIFDAKKDSWFDIDLVGNQVILKKRILKNEAMFLRG